MGEDKYPALLPGERFQGGESDEDLAARAVNEVIMPHVWSAARAGCAEHIVLVSHGVCIGALIAALLKRDSGGVNFTCEYTGMQNTAWARVIIKLQGTMDGTLMNLVDEEIPPLIVKATDFGRADHLLTLKHNAGGTGKIAYDSKQRDIRAFLGGATTAVAIEHCERNALDRIDGK